MENPEKMSAPDPALDANIDAMNVATPGKDAPNLDKTAPKRALFSSPSAVAHNKTNISTPTTTDKRDTRESKKNLMDNRHMKLADNEQMGDVRKQLRFNEEVHASANARKDMLQRRMIEMKRMEMEVRGGAVWMDLRGHAVHRHAILHSSFAAGLQVRIALDAQRQQQLLLETAEWSQCDGGTLCP